MSLSRTQSAQNAKPSHSGLSNIVSQSERHLRVAESPASNLFNAPSNNVKPVGRSSLPSMPSIEESPGTTDVRPAPAERRAPSQTNSSSQGKRSSATSGSSSVSERRSVSQQPIESPSEQMERNNYEQSLKVPSVTIAPVTNQPVIRIRDNSGPTRNSINKAIENHEQSAARLSRSRQSANDGDRDTNNRDSVRSVISQASNSSDRNIPTDTYSSASLHASRPTSIKSAVEDDRDHASAAPNVQQKTSPTEPIPSPSKPKLSPADLPPYAKPRQSKRISAADVPTAKDEPPAPPPVFVPVTVSAAGSTPVAAPPTAAEIASSARKSSRAWPPPNPAAKKDKDDATPATPSPAVASVPAKSSVAETPQGTPIAPPQAAPVSNSVAEMRRKLESQQKNANKDASPARTNLRPVAKNPLRKSNESADNSSSSSSPTQSPSATLASNTFFKKPIDSPHAQRRSGESELTLFADASASATTAPPIESQRSKKSEEDGETASVTSNTSRSSNSGLSKISKRASKDAVTELTKVAEDEASAAQKKIVPLGGMSKAEADSKRKLAAKLVDNALKSPVGGGAAASKGWGNTKDPAGKYEKSDKEGGGTPSNALSKLATESSQRIGTPADDTATRSDNQSGSPGIGSALAMKKSMDIVAQNSTGESNFNSLSNAIRAKHRRSFQRLPSLPPKASEDGAAAKSNRPVSIAERKRRLLDSNPLANSVDSTQSSVSSQRPPSSELPSVAEEETKEERLKREEKEDLEEHQGEMPSIDDKDFISLIHRLFEHRDALDTVWKRRSENIVENIAEIKFPAGSDVRQKNKSGNPVSKVDELYSAAKAAKANFNQAVVQASLEFNIPGVERFINPESCLYIPSAFKLLGRVVERAAKYREIYQIEERPGPQEAYVYDILRGRVLCSSQEQLVAFVRRISVAPQISVIRLKNRFAHPTPTGYRDILMTLAVSYRDQGSTSSHSSVFYCELQVTLESLHKLSTLKQRGLRLSLYEQFRGYFGRDNDAAAIGKRVEVLRELTSFPDISAEVDAFVETSSGLLYELANRAIASEDHDIIRATRDLFSKLEIGSGEALLQRALVINTQKKYGSHDIRVAIEIEVFGRLLMLDPEPDYDETTNLYIGSIDIKKSFYGEKHLNVAASMVSLAEVLEELDNLKTAKQVCLGALRIRTQILPVDHELIGECYNNLGVILEKLGELDEAIDTYKKAVSIRLASLGPNHPNLAVTYTNLAIAVNTKGDLKAAEKLLRDALDILNRAYGDEHPLVADAFVKLALLLNSTGQYEESLELLQNSLRIRKIVCGSNHCSVAESLKALSNVLRVMGKFAEARPAAEEALVIYSEIYGQKHPDTAAALNNVGDVLNAQGKYDEAETAFRIALKVRRKVHGDGAPEVAETLLNLSSVLKVKQQLDEAETTVQEAIAIYKAAYHDMHSSVAECSATLASIYATRNRYYSQYSFHHSFAYASFVVSWSSNDEAMALYEKALEITIHVHGPVHHYVATLKNNMAVLHKLKGDPDRAREMYEEALALRKQLYGKDHPNVAQVIVPFMCMRMHSRLTKRLIRSP